MIFFKIGVIKIFMIEFLKTSGIMGIKKAIVKVIVAVMIKINDNFLMFFDFNINNINNKSVNKIKIML